MERPSLVVILCFRHGTISKNGAFSNDLKGVVMENFPGGKPLDPHFFSLRTHLLSAPSSNSNFVPMSLSVQKSSYHCCKKLEISMWLCGLIIFEVKHLWFCLTCSLPFTSYFLGTYLLDGVLVQKICSVGGPLLETKLH